MLGRCLPDLAVDYIQAFEKIEEKSKSELQEVNVLTIVQR